MKTMTCNDLGGACNAQFHADTFDEMVEMSKKHGMEMVEKGDQAHIEAMEKAKQGMKDPDAMNKWVEKRREAFNALPEDK